MPTARTKPLVYLETSFISYLTARVSSDEIIARRQAATHRWWETEGAKYTPVVSEVVWAEALNGDAEQVSLRTELIKPFGSLPLTREAQSLADKLLAAHAIPPNSTTDALHVAIAATAGASLLLTWNCRHIANSETLPKTVLTIERAGYPCPAIATPIQRLEEKDDD
ncbi:MAG: type II toxin-antitoxin system VapC family toxin [Kiritimatiellae bacterium]|nr:type II toxin-antitoxin system VapC family toxin [Kiritimatiellia bacterium]